MKTKTVKDYTEFAVEKACELLAINSPSGYTDEAADWIVAQFKELGYKAKKTVKAAAKKIPDAAEKKPAKKPAAKKTAKKAEEK